MRLQRPGQFAQRCSFKSSNSFKYSIAFVTLALERRAVIPNATRCIY